MDVRVTHTTVFDGKRNIFRSRISAFEGIKLRIEIDNTGFFVRGTGFYKKPVIGYSSAIQQERQHATNLDMFLVGIFFITALYHMFLYLLRRQDRSPLVLAVLVLAAATRSLLAGNGRLLVNAELLPDLLTYRLEHAATCLVGFTYPAFITLVLKPERLGPNYIGPRWLYLPMAISGIATLTSFLPYPEMIEASLLAVQFSVVLLAISLPPWLVLATIRKQPQAWLITIGYLSPVALSLVDIVSYTLSSTNYNVGQWGVAVFVCCQAVMLSIRFNNLYLTVDRSQAELKTEIQARNHLLKELKKLVYKHQITSIRAGHDIESTMPVGRGFGCVLCFDIQHSSSIEHPQKDLFFQIALKRCHQMMMADYDSNTLRASAYMVKEMGDGFICSVGFPFKTDEDIYEKAYQLAENLVKLFQDQVKNYFDHLDVYCSIGIASGDITGYYPTIGLKQYDLHGSAIIKATRYEGFRKILFSSGQIPRSNIIIVQQNVFDQLRPDLQDRLTKYALNQINVRDDPDAKALYYQCIGPSESTSIHGPKNQAS
jgi:hypothetical protein